jgi:hypothetical protein
MAASEDYRETTEDEAKRTAAEQHETMVEEAGERAQRFSNGDNYAHFKKSTGMDGQNSYKKMSYMMINSSLIGKLVSCCQRIAQIETLTCYALSSSAPSK